MSFVQIISSKGQLSLNSSLEINSHAWFTGSNYSFHFEVNDLFFLYEYSSYFEIDNLFWIEIYFPIPTVWLNVDAVSFYSVANTVQKAHQGVSHNVLRLNGGTGDRQQPYISSRRWRTTDYQSPLSTIHTVTFHSECHSVSSCILRHY